MLQPTGSLLGIADLIVLFSYLALVAAIGIMAGRRQRTSKDYFLGDRQIPWWAAGLSIIATETSAMTFIGAPVQSLRGDWTYLQLALGSAIARFFVAAVLIKAYYKAGAYTPYDYLGQRFGPLSRNLASALFLVGRLLGSGVRLYGAAIALVIIMNLDFPLAIALIATLSVMYTVLGGIRSVVWTDTLQGVLLVTGGVLAVVFLLRETGLSPAGAVSALGEGATAGGHSKLRILNLSLDPKTAYTLAAGLVGSTFLTMATHGTDHDLVQRSLSCRGAKEGSKSLLLSAVLAPAVAALFLTVGSLLWLHLGGNAGTAETASAIASREGLASAERAYDFIFPDVMTQLLPAGLKGLLLAALFATAMSSLDSAIAAMSTTVVRTFVVPYRQLTERQQLQWARAFAIVAGLLLVSVALVVWQTEGSGGESEGFGVLMLGLKVLSWIFPPLLGVFLLAVLTRRGSDLGNVCALTGGVSALLLVESWPALFGTPPPFAWTWNPLVGCGLSFAIGVAFRGTGKRPNPA